MGLDRKLLAVQSRKMVELQPCRRKAEHSSSNAALSSARKTNYSQLIASAPKHRPEGCYPCSGVPDWVEAAKTQLGQSLLCICGDYFISRLI